MCVMKIMKFGGTSVGSAARIASVGKLISDGESKIVVLSAMSGTTNSLVKISEALKKGDKVGAREVIEALSEKYQKVIEELFPTKNEFAAKAYSYAMGVMDMLRGLVDVSYEPIYEKVIVAQGELLSTNLMHLHLIDCGVENTLLPALDFMRIDKDGDPDYFYIRHSIEREIKLAQAGKLIITQGFICRNSSGDIDNLKRGGSDYSASLIAQAVKADEIQIWTDIDGFHNNDPRVVEKTRAIRHLSFDEAAELAYFGAKILHPATVQPAKMAGIPVRLKNTLNPADEGTLITGDAKLESVKAVAAKDGITAIKIVSTNMLLAYGFLRKVFEVFEKWRTPIDMITTSEVSVSLTIDDISNLDHIIEDLQDYGTMEIDREMTIVCVVGDFVSNREGNLAKVLGALSGIPIRMVSFGGIDHNLSILVRTADKKATLNALNDKLLNKA